MKIIKAFVTLFILLSAISCKNERIAVLTETKNRGILYLILLIERFRSKT